MWGAYGSLTSRIASWLACSAPRPSWRYWPAWSSSGGIGWTASADALMTAVLIATLAFGLPAIAMFALAYWLDLQAAALEGQRREELARKRDDTARHPFREPAFGYVFAVVAAMVAWGLRMVIDPYLPGFGSLHHLFHRGCRGWLGRWIWSCSAHDGTVRVHRALLLHEPSAKLSTPESDGRHTPWILRLRLPQHGRPDGGAALRVATCADARQ